MPPLLRIVSGIVFLAFAAGVHVYLYRRLVRDVTPHPKVRVGALSAFGTVAATSIFGFSRVRSGAPGPLTALLPMWFGLVIYVLLALVVIDVLRLVFRRKLEPAPTSDDRRLFLSRAVAATSVIAGSGLASFGAFRAFSPPQVTEVPLNIARLPRALDGFTLAQLSDVHIGPVLDRKWLEELVARSNQAKPDLVAITGDLVDGKPEHIGAAVEALRGLKGRYGTYFVTGNHDYYSGADAWVATLQGWGITVLRNRRVKVGGPDASFDLIGVDDWGAAGGAGIVAPREYDLQKAIAGRSPDRASVLLAHQPANFDAVAEAGVDLQLSGHTHGGQTFPGTAAAQLIWGDRARGLSKTKGSYLYVSRGCGFVGPTTRLGSPPEIVKIVLTSA